MARKNKAKKQIQAILWEEYEEQREDIIRKQISYDLATELENALWSAIECELLDQLEYNTKAQLRAQAFKAQAVETTEDLTD